MSNDLRLEPTGHTAPAITAKVAEVHGRARNEAIRIVAGAIILLLLAGAYFWTLVQGKESTGLLAIISGGLGYLLGVRSGDTKA